MGNKLRHEGDEVRIKVIWPDLCGFAIDDPKHVWPCWWSEQCRSTREASPLPLRNMAATLDPSRKDGRCTSHVIYPLVI